jgi:hypothetical protein
MSHTVVQADTEPTSFIGKFVCANDNNVEKELGVCGGKSSISHHLHCDPTRVTYVVALGGPGCTHVRHR